MNVTWGRVGVISNATTPWEASIVPATPPLTWILTERPVSQLVCTMSLESVC